MKFPVYKLDLKKLKENEKQNGVFTISLVDSPAIMRKFELFSQANKTDNTKQLFLDQFDNDKRIISGYAMLPNLPIYRYDEESKEEYFIKYSIEDIEYLQNLFMKDKDIHSTNIMHNPDLALSKDDIFLFESFIVDNKRGVNVSEKYGKQIQGGWFVSYKVLNDNLWNELKTGKTKLSGFSVELSGYHEPINEEKYDIDEEILDKLIDIFNK